jgi:hypothetical protein
MAPPSGGTRDDCRPQDRLTRHPREGQQRAGAERDRNRDRVSPARDTLMCARDRSQRQDAARLVCGKGKIDSVGIPIVRAGS